MVARKTGSRLEIYLDEIRTPGRIQETFRFTFRSVCRQLKELIASFANPAALTETRKIVFGLRVRAI